MHHKCPLKKYVSKIIAVFFKLIASFQIRKKKNKTNNDTVQQYKNITVYMTAPAKRRVSQMIYKLRVSATH